MCSFCSLSKHVQISTFYFIMHGLCNSMEVVLHLLVVISLFLLVCFPLIMFVHMQRRPFQCDPHHIIQGFLSAWSQSDQSNENGAEAFLTIVHESML